MDRKTVGDDIKAGNSSWTFGGNVPLVFENHVAKSVPLYEEGHDLILKVSDFFLSDSSVCYDIGCSTGLLLRKLSNRHHKSIRFVGLDVEGDMIEHARNQASEIDNLDFVESDILTHDFESCDLVISYYTVQFIKPRVRQQVFDKIYESLNWGGAFLLFEKVRANDARFQDICSSLYTDYKLDQGYSADEIVSKSKSLKGVLEPFSTEGNLGLLARAGFKDVISAMKYVSFEGFLAIK